MTQRFFGSTPKVRLLHMICPSDAHSSTATVPVLVVPYENSLSEDTESRYKALIETKVGVISSDYTL